MKELKKWFFRIILIAFCIKYITKFSCLEAKLFGLPKQVLYIIEQ